jgi:putative ABC transport system substrate-binding protein
MRRREFITLLGGAPAAWPLAARAQQGDRVRRIGVLIPGDENDPVSKTWVFAFTQALAGLGWTDGRNVRIDLRGARGDTNRMRALAQELVGLQPDIILVGGPTATSALQRETRTIPIVLLGGDPVPNGDCRRRGGGIAHSRQSAISWRRCNVNAQRRPQIAFCAIALRWPSGAMWQHCRPGY